MAPLTTSDPTAQLIAHGESIAYALEIPVLHYFIDIPWWNMRHIPITTQKGESATDYMRPGDTS